MQRLFQGLCVVQLSLLVLVVGGGALAAVIDTSFGTSALQWLIQCDVAFSKWQMITVGFSLAFYAMLWERHLLVAVLISVIGLGGFGLLGHRLYQHVGEVSRECLRDGVIKQLFHAFVVIAGLAVVIAVGTMVASFVTGLFYTYWKSPEEGSGIASSILRGGTQALREYLRFVFGFFFQHPVLVLLLLLIPAKVLSRRSTAERERMGGGG